MNAVRDGGDTGWTRASVTLTGALFIYMTAEMFPVGVVPELAAGLGCSRAAAGTLLAVYAIATGVVIVPVVALTRHMDRRRLIVASLLVLAVSQVAFALAGNLWWAYAARAVAAVPHGLLWSVVPTVAASMNPGAPGRATARVFVGGALGLVVGAPAVTAVTGEIGWRPTAAAVGVLALVLAIAARATLAPGATPDHSESGAPHRGTQRLPTIPAQVYAIGAATVATVTACYIPYTYLSVLADHVDIRSTSLSLLQIGYGAAGLVSVSLVGRFLDNRLRAVLTVILVGMASALTVVTVTDESAPFTLAVLLWGAAFACAAPALQSAVLRVSDRDTRVDPLATSAVYVLAFQIGIASGSWAGSGILTTAGAAWLAPAGLIAIGVAATVVVLMPPPKNAGG